MFLSLCLKVMSYFQSLAISLLLNRLQTLREMCSGEREGRHRGRAHYRPRGKEPPQTISFSRGGKEWVCMTDWSASKWTFHFPQINSNQVSSCQIPPRKNACAGKREVMQRASLLWSYRSLRATQKVHGNTRNKEHSKHVFRASVWSVTAEKTERPNCLSSRLILWLPNLPTLLFKFTRAPYHSSISAFVCTGGNKALLKRETGLRSLQHNPG